MLINRQKNIKRVYRSTLLVLGMGATFLTHAAPPPNTINMNNVNSVLATNPSPVSYAPPVVQQYIAPNIPSLVQGTVTDYIQAQLTPAQLQEMKQQYIETSRVLSTPYVEVPRPVIRSVAVTLRPGETPPIIRLARNMVTNIVITDSEGNPWAIEQAVMNTQQFINHSMPVLDENGNATNTNIITIEPTDAVSWSNMSVTLKGKATPLIFLLTSGQPEVDMRVDALVAGRSPSAKYIPGYSPVQSITSVDSDALGFLDGSIPEQAEEMKTSDIAVRAWKLNDKLYVKTRLDVLYPSYSSKASSVESENIYRFDTVLNENGNGSVTFTQRNGQPVTVRIENNPYSYLK